MGRKSVKGKQKRIQRKQENLLFSEALRQVNRANEQTDPLSKFTSFQVFENLGLSVTLECKRVKHLEQTVIDWAFKLLKRNMQTLYESCSWGWNEDSKYNEMTEPLAWYLIAKLPDGEPCAFSHFRFDMDYGVEVLYCYEIQLESSVRRRGLGKFMMQILELMGFSAGMRKVVLTVLKHNPGAVSFFKALNYTLDETSPVDEFEDHSYEILSKPNKMLQKTQANCL